MSNNNNGVPFIPPYWYGSPALRIAHAQQANATPQSFSQQAAAQYNAAQGMTQAQISAYNQQLWQNLAASPQIYHAAAQRHMWMWDGIAMDIKDFAYHAYGDTAEATHFLLKYTPMGEIE